MVSSAYFFLHSLLLILVSWNSVKNDDDGEDEVKKVRSNFEIISICFLVKWIDFDFDWFCFALISRSKIRFYFSKIVFID